MFPIDTLSISLTTPDASMDPKSAGSQLTITISVSIADSSTVKDPGTSVTFTVLVSEHPVASSVTITV